LALFKRGNTYWIKVRVPKDLREVYSGDFVRESLGTTRRRDAQVKHDIRAGEIKCGFQQRRDEARGIKTYDREDLRAWARMAAYRPEQAFLKAVNPLGLASGTGQTISGLREELASVPRLAVENADEFIERRELALPKDSESYAYFLGCVRNYLTDQITLDLRVLLGSQQPEFIAVRPPDTPSPFTTTPSPENEDDTSNLGGAGKTTLIEAVERFKSAEGWRKRTPKTQAAYGESFRLLLRFLTETRYVHTIRPGDVEAFREILNALPVNCPKQGDLRDAIRGPEEKIASGTKNRHITAIRQLFGFLKKQWFIRYDPSLSLSRFDGKQKWIRVPFTEADLKAMFLGDTLHRGDHESVYHWLPLLALFTGARRNELCQLQPGDIVQHQGVWCLRITTDSEDEAESKSLKTHGAQRLVPLHPMLLKRFGFLEFVARNRQNPNGRIFRELTYTMVNQWGGKFDKSFHRRLAEIITRRKGNTTKGFHSFRHLVNDKLGEARVEYGVIDALLGWSSHERSVAMRDHYGDRETPFRKLVEAVNCLEYPWL